MILEIANLGANPVNCFPHPSDPTNSINGQAANTPVILGPNTITPFQCFSAGIWLADSIGTGFAGSLETVVPQNNVTAVGTSQATATQLTQAMATVSTVPVGTGVNLPVSARRSALNCFRGRESMTASLHAETMAKVRNALTETARPRKHPKKTPQENTLAAFLAVIDSLCPAMA